MSEGPKRLRNWIVVINNPIEMDYAAWSALTEPAVRFARVQTERGESGTLHLQGMVCFRLQKTFTAVKRQFPRAHLEPCFKLEASAKYCAKEERNLQNGDPEFALTLGTVPRGYGNDLTEVMEGIIKGDITSETQLAAEHTGVYGRNMPVLRRLMELYSKAESPPVREGFELHIAYGDAGAGKSRWSRELAVEIAGGIDAVYFVKVGAGGFFDGYDGQEVAVWDDFASNQIGLQAFNRFMSEEPMHLNVKFGNKANCIRKVYLTTNYAPTGWWSGVQRTSDGPTLRLSWLRRITTLQFFAGRWPSVTREDMTASLRAFQLGEQRNIERAERVDELRAFVSAGGAAGEGGGEVSASVGRGRPAETSDL